MSLSDQSLLVKIKVNPSSSRLKLTDEEQSEISQEVQTAFSIAWLDEEKNKNQSRLLIETKKHLALESTVLIVFVGSVVGAIIKPFFEGVLQEAGKDFWNEVKQLTAKIWKKQNEKAYSLSCYTILMFEEENKHIAIELFLHDMKPNASESDYETVIAEKIENVLGQMDSISSSIQCLSGEPNPEKQIFVVRPVGSKNCEVNSMQQNMFTQFYRVSL